MSKLYIFSQNDFLIKSLKSQNHLNKFQSIYIEDYNNEDLELIEKIDNQTYSSILNLQNISTQNIRFAKIDNMSYYEIIYINNSTPLQKFSSKSCEILIYKNHIQILCESKYYTYYFNATDECNFVEQDDILYIFNATNILEFNTKNKVFNAKFVEKTAKNEQKHEILCKISKNCKYFVLYKIDISNNRIDKIQYQKDNILEFNDYSLPFVFFHLCKDNFDDAKNLISEKLNFYEIKNYLNQFDNLYEIDGEYFLSSHNQICKINIVIENNLVIDVD